MKFISGLKPLQVLALGYVAVILTGAVLLSLPIATHGSISFLDAAFTATSAACVTGLVVFDTFQTFAPFGQAIILALIQIGGLGFMLMIASFSILLGRRIGLRERSLVMESISGLQIGGIVLLAKRVAIATAIIEIAGAFLLALRFCPVYGLSQGIWMGVFHSVSAFCNAGFDLMGAGGFFISLTDFVYDPLVNLVIIVLILLGGLGFLVWNDLITNRFHFRKYRLHTKIMLVSSALLVFGGAALFFFFEKDAAFKGMTFGQRALASLFQSVTPRTAGFNTVAMDSLSEPGALITILFMFIGGGSGSTAGGVKVTTFVVAYLTVRAFIGRKRDIETLGRRLDGAAPRKALSQIGLHAALAFAGCVALCCEGASIKEAMFESVSAISTVGLSLGITSTLSVLSKLVIMFLMYVGRVGSLSFAMAMSEKHMEATNVRHMEEKIIIG
ncbi:MAG: potassium transporter TrkG [Clostridia bacterium]|nr:potassium transporter TrkG [Clostridia bacterium]